MPPFWTYEFKGTKMLPYPNSKSDSQVFDNGSETKPWMAEGLVIWSSHIIAKYFDIFTNLENIAIYINILQTIQTWGIPLNRLNHSLGVAISIF